MTENQNYLPSKIWTGDATEDEIHNYGERLIKIIRTVTPLTKEYIKNATGITHGQRLTERHVRLLESLLRAYIKTNKAAYDAAFTIHLDIESGGKR
jgi:hypothetical protein